MNEVSVVLLTESWKFTDVKCMWAKKKKKKKISRHHYFAVFPGCLGDTQFCFRFRQGSNRKSSLGCFLETTDRDAPPCLKVCRHIHDFGPMACNVLCMSGVWLTRVFVRLFSEGTGSLLRLRVLPSGARQVLEERIFPEGQWLVILQLLQNQPRLSKSHISICWLYMLTTVVMAWVYIAPFF